MTVIEHMTDVFDAVMDWLSTALGSIVNIFYVPETGLTILGVLAVIGLAISVVLLLINIISNFFHLRG